MRIVGFELKKIWNWKILGVIAVVCALFYVLFMAYYIDFYRTDHPQTEDIYYAEKLVRQLGASVTEAELAAFIAVERAVLIAEAEVYIQTMPIFAEAGIFTFADYAVLREDWERNWTQEENDAYWTLLGEECDYLGFKLQSLDYMERYVGISATYIGNPDSFWGRFNERERTRYAQMIENGENMSILSYWTYEATARYTLYFSILLMLCVLILVSPLLTTDRHRKVHHLQYSSMHGRNIMRSQLVAVLLSALALTTLMIVIFGALFSANGTHLFWEAYTSSDLNGPVSVFSLTYGQWVIAMIVLLYALAPGIALFAFILSRFSGSLITLAMKLVPVFTAAAFLCIFVFNGLLHIGNVLYRMFQIFGSEIYVCGIICVTALAASAIITAREKRVDVL